METRRLQRVGYSSFSLSLPRQWIVKNQLKPGDPLAVMEEADGALRIEPWREQQTTYSYKIEIDETLDPTLLRRLLVGCYMLGYDTITIESPNELNPEQLETISNVVRRLRGFEMVDVSIRQLLVQGFLEPTRFPVDKLLLRMQSMVSTMFENILRAIQENRPELANEALRIKVDVDELYWLIVRQLLLSLRSTEVSRKLGIDSPLHAVGTRMVSKTVEEISTFLEAAANELTEIREATASLDPSLKDELVSYGRLVKNVFEATMKALYTPNLHQLIVSSELESQAIEFEKRVSRTVSSLQHTRLAATLKSLLWHLELITKYCGIISEITVHRYLRTPSPRLPKQKLVYRASK